MGRGVESETPQLPVGVKDGRGIRRRGMDFGSNGPQRIRSMNENLSQRHCGRRPQHVETAIGGCPEAPTKLRHGQISETPRRSAQGPVRSESSSDHVGPHRELGRFCEVDEMSESIPDPPSVAPGRFVPCSLVQCLYLISQLKTLTS